MPLLLEMFCYFHCTTWTRHVFLDGSTQKGLLGSMSAFSIKQRHLPNIVLPLCHVSGGNPGAQPHLCPVQTQLTPQVCKAQKYILLGVDCMKMYKQQGQQIWQIFPFKKVSVLPESTPLLLNIWFSGIQLLLTSPTSYVRLEMPHCFWVNYLININTCKEYS